MPNISFAFLFKLVLLVVQCYLLILIHCREKGILIHVADKLLFSSILACFFTFPSISHLCLHFTSVPRIPSSYSAATVTWKTIITLRYLHRHQQHRPSSPSSHPHQIFNTLPRQQTTQRQLPQIPPSHSSPHRHPSPFRSSNLLGRWIHFVIDLESMVFLHNRDSHD